MSNVEKRVLMETAGENLKPAPTERDSDALAAEQTAADILVTEVPESAELLRLNRLKDIAESKLAGLHRDVQEIEERLNEAETKQNVSETKRQKSLLARVQKEIDGAEEGLNRVLEEIESDNRRTIKRNAKEKTPDMIALKIKLESEREVQNSLVEKAQKELDQALGALSQLERQRGVLSSDLQSRADEVKKKWASFDVKVNNEVSYLRTEPSMRSTMTGMLVGNIDDIARENVERDWIGKRPKELSIDIESDADFFRSALVEVNKRKMELEKLKSDARKTESALKTYLDDK